MINVMKNIKDKIFESDAAERTKLFNRLEKLIEDNYGNPMEFIDDFFEYIPTNIIKNALYKLEDYNN